MKIDFLTQYKGKNVRIKTKYYETITGRLDIVDSEYVQIGNTFIKAGVIQQIEEMPSNNE
jgi:hypothetical protein